MCVNVIKTEYDLINLNRDGSTTLMDDKGEFREYISIDTCADIYKDIKEPLENNLNVVVTVLSAMNSERIVPYRVDKKD